MTPIGAMTHPTSRRRLWGTRRSRHFMHAVTLQVLLPWRVHIGLEPAKTGCEKLEIVNSPTQQCGAPGR